MRCGTDAEDKRQLRLERDTATRHGGRATGPEHIAPALGPLLSAVLLPGAT